eukprot:scaffold24011_cov304-Cylindrotheca_fusiformis.AAC.1
MSTNDLLRQLMLETRASNQKLQEGQTSLYHSLTALDHKHQAAATEITGINHQLIQMQQEMQRMESEHRVLVQQVAMIDAKTAFSNRPKKSSSDNTSDNNSSSSEDTASQMDYPDEEESDNAPNSPYEVMRRIQQPANGTQESADTTMEDMCPSENEDDRQHSDNESHAGGETPAWSP